MVEGYPESDIFYRAGPYVWRGECPVSIRRRMEYLMELASLLNRGLISIEDYPYPVVRSITIILDELEKITAEEMNNATRQ